MLEGENNLADKMRAGRPKVFVWSLQVTTDLPLMWYKVAELSQTQNNYLSLESVVTQTHRRGFLQTPSPTRCRQHIPPLCSQNRCHAEE